MACCCPFNPISWECELSWGQGSSCRKACVKTSQVLTLCSLIKNWGSPLLLKGYFHLGGEGRGRRVVKGILSQEADISTRKMRMYWLYLRSPASYQGQPIACSTERRKTKRGCPTTDQICLSEIQQLELQ